MSDDRIIGSGLSEPELTFAAWWMRHRPLLHRLRFITLILVNVSVWGYVLWSLADAFIISAPHEQTLFRRLAQTELIPATVQATGPKSLLFGQALLFSSTGDRQDFSIELQNPNAQWWATFTYRFDTGEETTKQRAGYILPNNSALLTEIGWKGTNRAQNAQLQITDIAWHRVQPATTKGNYEAFAESHMGFQISDIQYRNDVTVGTQTIGQTTLLFRNPTGYGFWSVPLTIILQRADGPAAIATLDLRNIRPNETRAVSLNWFDSLTGITDTTVRADVNIFDPATYLPSDRL